VETFYDVEAIVDEDEDEEEDEEDGCTKHVFSFCST
jgi:hypothetical protein